MKNRTPAHPPASDHRRLTCDKFQHHQRPPTISPPGCIHIMSVPLTQQETLASDFHLQTDPNHTEKISSPHASSTRPLMPEDQGRTASMYTHTGPELMGGGALGRQISIQLTPEQFEKLYLQPGESRRRSRPPEVADGVNWLKCRRYRCAETRRFHKTFVRLA